MSNASDAARFARVYSSAAKQVSFALAVSLNDTGLDIQRAQVERMHSIFEVRNRRFIGDPATPHRSAIKRTQKATKSQPVVELAVLPPGGLARANIITRHQRDRVRRPHNGGSLLVPIEAKRTKTGRIRKSMNPKDLGFQRVDKGRGRMQVFKGRGRTFMVREAVGGRGWIFRRRGRGGRLFEGTQVLFAFKKQTPLTPNLEFFATAEKTFQQKFPEQFAKAYKRALETAR